MPLPRLLHPTHDVRLRAPASPPRGPAAASRGDGALAAVDEMLDSLDTVTRAGQQHMMRKIVSLLATHPLIAAAGPFIQPRVEDLRREAEKSAPDGTTFVHAARSLLAMTRPAS